jgi:hypothetical protein
MMQDEKKRLQEDEQDQLQEKGLGNDERETVGFRKSRKVRRRVD